MQSPKGNTPCSEYIDILGERRHYTWEDLRTSRALDKGGSLDFVEGDEDAERRHEKYLAREIPKFTKFVKGSDWKKKGVFDADAFQKDLLSRTSAASLVKGTKKKDRQAAKVPDESLKELQLDEARPPFTTADDSLKHNINDVFLLHHGSKVQTKTSGSYTMTVTLTKPPEKRYYTAVEWTIALCLRLGCSPFEYKDRDTDDTQHRAEVTHTLRKWARTLDRSIQITRSFDHDLFLADLLSRPPALTKAEAMIGGDIGRLWMMSRKLTTKSNRRLHEAIAEALHDGTMLTDINIKAPDRLKLDRLLDEAIPQFANWVGESIFKNDDFDKQRFERDLLSRTSKTPPQAEYMVTEELEDLWLLNHGTTGPEGRNYPCLNVAKLANPEEGRKYTMPDAMIATALRDGGSLFIERMKPVQSAEKITKAIKDWSKWLAGTEFTNEIFDLQLFQESLFARQSTESRRQDDWDLMATHQSDSNKSTSYDDSTPQSEHGSSQNKDDAPEDRDTTKDKDDTAKNKDDTPKDNY